MPRFRKKGHRSDAPSRPHATCMRLQSSQPKGRERHGPSARLATESEGAPLLAPLMINEIILRLLLSPMGTRSLRSAWRIPAFTRSPGRFRGFAKISQAIKVEVLTEMGGDEHVILSSAFQGSDIDSPSQFQKLLRLQEARTLGPMMMDVNTASLRTSANCETRILQDAIEPGKNEPGTRCTPDFESGSFGHERCSSSLGISPLSRPSGE